MIKETRKEKEMQKDSEIFNKSEYIILPERYHGSHSYPDLYVAKNRLRADSHVKTTARDKLDLKVRNTRCDLGNRLFIGNITWDEALKLNLVLGGETLTLRRFIDFKEWLGYGIEGGKVYHGTGKQMHDLREIRAIYKEIFAKKDPYRGEHLDARFEKKSGELHICYSHYLRNNKLVPKISERLGKDIISSDKLDLISYNSQGLPFLKEEIYFYDSTDGSVAWFDAGSGRAILGCSGNPLSSNSSLGVRHARKKI